MLIPVNLALDQFEDMQATGLLGSFESEQNQGGWGDAAVGGLADPGGLAEGQGRWE
jgi:hypothetical protein